MNEELLCEFNKRFPIIIGDKSEPYIILFDAFTGMGKSYVSKIISKYDKSVIINNDEIRDFLNDYDDKSDNKDLLVKYRLELLLKNNNSCILDSCLSHNSDKKLEYYKSLGYKYYIIRLVCSDGVIKDRLSKRVLSSDNYSIASYDDYLWMKNNVSMVDNEPIDFVINTEEDIEVQVIEFVKNILNINI